MQGTTDSPGQGHLLALRHQTPSVSGKPRPSVSFAKLHGKRQLDEQRRGSWQQARTRWSCNCNGLVRVAKAKATATGSFATSGCRAAACSAAVCFAAAAGAAIANRSRVSQKTKGFNWSRSARGSCKGGFVSRACSHFAEKKALQQRQQHGTVSCVSAPPSSSSSSSACAQAQRCLAARDRSHNLTNFFSRSWRMSKGFAAERQARSA